MGALSRDYSTIMISVKYSTQNFIFTNSVISMAMKLKEKEDFTYPCIYFKSHVEISGKQTAMRPISYVPSCMC